MLPAFGMQKTMFSGGVVDEDGYLRENPSEPAWNLLRVSGQVDVPRLAQAVKTVTEATEILHLRVRSSSDGPRLVPVALPYELEVLEAESLVADGRLAPDLAKQLAPLLFDKIDLRERAAGRICLVRGPGDESLLALSFDHTLLDGWSLGLFLRSLIQCYRSGEHAPRGPSFREFVLSLPDRATQDASLAAWGELLTDHPVPGPSLRFPGGRDKPPGDYRIDGYFDATFPAAVADDLSVAVKHTSLSRAELLTAAAALAVSMWSDGPQPMLSLRHGHTQPDDILVVGPLVEPYVLLPPSSAETVAGWLVGHQEANRETPPLYGRSIREVTPLVPRNAALNIVPPARPVPFGDGIKAVTASREFVEPLWAGGRPVVPSTAGMWINLFMDQPGRIEICVTYDQELLPDPAVLADSLQAVVAAAANAPDTPLAALRPRLRELGGS